MPAAVTSDGASLAYEVTGSGPWLLLIAGQGVSQSSWRPILPALAARFRVLSYDHRGVRDSTDGDAPSATTRGLAADAISVMDAAGAASAFVLGHSMGGRIAQWLAIDHPDRVDRLVLVSTTAGDASGPARSAEAGADLASLDTTRLATRFFSDAFAAAHPEAIDLIVKSRIGPGARRRYFRASAEHDTTALLGGIDVPTLVVHGTDDAITPIEHGRRLAHGIPGALFLPVEGGRHAPQIDHPEVVEQISDFLLD